MVKETTETRTVELAHKNYDAEVWISRSKFHEATKEFDKVRLLKDRGSLEVFVADPKSLSTDKLKTDVIIDTSNCKRKYDDGDEKHFYLVAQDCVVGLYNNTKNPSSFQCLIEDSKKQMFSAYNWDKFGFKVYDNTSFWHFFGAKSAFLKEVIKVLDSDKDGELRDDELPRERSGEVSEIELARVRHDRFAIEKLSKMVCKHDSEWSSNSNEYRLEEAREYLDEIKVPKGADKAKVKKSKDERLDAFKAHLENSSFIDELDCFKSSSKEFYYFHPIAFVEQMKRILTGECPLCTKKHIDLRPKMAFKKQEGGTDCKKASDKIVKGCTGYNSEDRGSVAQEIPYAAFYQVATETSGKNFTFYPDKIKEGLEFLNLALDKGFPVVVGVNHTSRADKKEGTKDYNKKSTDHFVIIVGRHCEKGIIYYRFWDVGTSRGKTGDFKFKLTDKNHLICDKTYHSTSKTYTVTQIRRFRKDDRSVITLDKLKLKQKIL